MSDPMRSYYNEHDPFAAAWLRELIADNLITPGDVDERSIADVQPSDLSGYTQCHFFAGIGGWSYALRLAGWPDDRPVWTGSCPCQPFSAAGRGDGHADPRHLWPEWFRLIRESRPATVFGEQVSAAIRHGWWDAVQGDLEGEGYACGMGVYGAHSVGASHIRQRLWFVADRDTTRRGSRRTGETSDGRNAARVEPSGLCASVRMDNTPSPRHEQAGAINVVADLSSPWSSLLWLPCRDGKARPTQSLLQSVADGLPAELGYVRDPSAEGQAYLSPLITGATNRVGRLRGYGNAINPYVAATFINASVEALADLDTHA